jgi:hypothetical protein
MNDEARDQEAEVGDQAEAVALLAAMFSGSAGTSLDQVAGPRLWPAVTAEEATERWVELREWVAELIRRFEHLDHHVIPLCWWRHNSHVEALMALRDHERMSYSDSSPPSAAVEWHRAFRDIEARLREWTSTLACGSHHDPRSRPIRNIDEDEWARFVAEDAKHRASSHVPPAEPSTEASQRDDDTTPEDDQDE